jgi:META domain
MDERPIQLLDRLAPEVDVAAARRVFEARARLERRRRRVASGGSAMVALLLLFVGIRSLTTRDPGHVLVQPLAPSPDGRWKLVSGVDGAAESGVTLIIEGSKVGGSGGCNGYGGEVEFGAGGEWTSSEGILRRLRVCEWSAVEEKYFSVLDRVTTFAVEDGGGTLVLSGPGGELRFQRDLTPVAPPAPAAPSVDGTWQLVSASGGAGEGIDPSEVTLAIVGSRIGGTAGCSELNGVLVARNTKNGEQLEIGFIEASTFSVALLRGKCPDISWVANLKNNAVRVTSDDFLEMSTEEFGMKFKRVSAAASLPLIGTRWELVTVLDRNRAAKALVGPYLQIAADGSVDASTGIDQMAGNLTGSGGLRNIESYRKVDDRSTISWHESYVAQAGTVDAVLRHEFSLVIDGATLTISDLYGNVLRYTGVASLSPLPAGTLGDEPSPSTTLPRPG